MNPHEKKQPPKKYPDRELIMRLTGRPTEPEKDNVRSIKQVLENNAILCKLLTRREKD